MLPRLPPQEKPYCLLSWFPGAASVMHDRPFVGLGEGLATQ
jgi:hypothetical protein